MRALMFSLALCMALPAVAQSQKPASADPLRWLQDMNTAVRETTYEGIAVYRTGDHLETLRVFHRNVDGQEQERMVSLSGDPREVRREQNKVTCVLPEQEAVVVDNNGLQGLLPNLSRAAFEQLSSHYELRQIEGARIAGRQCVGIEVASKDAYRYSYRIWLDQQTALPLSVNLIGDDGDILEQVVFTQIKFPETLDDDVFRTSVDTKGFRELVQPAESADAGALAEWEVAEVPQGFRLATRELQRLPGTDKQITHMLFTDGLAAVSIFTAAEDVPEKSLQGISRVGGVNAYGRKVGDFHVTVVGEVPQTTVRHFADHLRRVNAPR